MPGELAFVVPRYGEHILGGAETLVRTFAEHLTRRGRAVSVFTTCIRSYETWNNEDAPGRTRLNGVEIHRFPVATGWDTPRAADLWQRAPVLSVDEQYEWVGRLPQSPSLYRALVHQSERFDLIVFAPYLRSTTYLGAMAVVDKAVMWPCLHDEAYAYFHPTRVLLARARGVAYNTDTERELAHRLGARNPAEHVIGAGVELDVTPNPDVQLPVSGLYVMYAGRMEGAKNYGLLAEYFMRFKARHPGELKLVVSGTGAQENIRHPDIVHLGFLPRADMLAVMRNATVFCQPSVNESFSYVIMEAWLAGAPVMVHRHCAVTFEHVNKSQGGLAFADYAEFEVALRRLVGHPGLRQEMAHAGQAYVRRQYNWDAVLARLEAAIQTWRATPPEPNNQQLQCTTGDP